VAPGVLYEESETLEEEDRRMLRISDNERRQRITAVQAELQAGELGAFVVSSREGIFYLTGLVCDPLERPMFLVVLPDRQPAFVVPVLERDHICDTLRTDNVEVYSEFPAPQGKRWDDKLREVLDGTANIGVEPSLGYELVRRLEGFRVQSSSLLDGLRVRKSPQEIELIRHASRFAVLGVRRLLAASYRGATVAEGFAETRTVVRRMIAEIDGWEPLSNRALMATWAAPRSAQPHSIPRLTDRLGSGPHVALVLTAVRGYAAECERTYFTWKPAPEVRRAFEVMLEARKLAFDMARPGTACSRLDAKISRFLSDQGHDANRLHRTGHGIGLARHAEAPWIADGSDDVLSPGMVMSIEPGIYLPGIGGLRHSDTVLITEQGPECLTPFPTDLDSLTVGSLRLGARLAGFFKSRSLRVPARRLHNSYGP
jgi:Xaa-Pro dipeptidase